MNDRLKVLYFEFAIALEALKNLSSDFLPGSDRRFADALEKAKAAKNAVFMAENGKG